MQVDFSSCSHQELQSKAIEYGISPDLDTDELIKSLRDILQPESAAESTSLKKRKRHKKKKQEPTVAVKIEDVKDESITIEYVPEELNVQEFAHVFAKFSNPNEFDNVQVVQEDDEEDEMEIESNLDEEEQQINLKKLKRMQRMGVGDLKRLVKHPDDVEWTDTASSDPAFLVHLKTSHNAVPVPVHWSQKKKYLQSKRGYLKKPFDLPDFIRMTGIMEVRETVREKEDAASLKRKAREKLRPKMGKIDIDYQKLHDAFFKYQTKPHMTSHGEIYFEGKENEARLDMKRPGFLSEELKGALNMGLKTPPPWLINMQRYGPPPSYPGLKIPGLNAPLPEGAQWGYHPGGWGKPPVDEYNRPLYGNVFAPPEKESAGPEYDYNVDKTLWGEYKEFAIESEEEEEEDFDMTEIPQDTVEVTEAPQEQVELSLNPEDILDGISKETLQKKLSKEEKRKSDFKF